MTEPGNLTGWIDAGGGTWVRVDDCPGGGGSWWPITDGPGFDPRAWDNMAEYGPFTPADPDRTARALALVRAGLTR